LDKDDAGKKIKFPDAAMEAAMKKACAALGKKWGVDGTGLFTN